CVSTTWTDSPIAADSRCATHEAGACSATTTTAMTRQNSTSAARRPIGSPGAEVGSGFVEARSPMARTSAGEREFRAHASGLHSRDERRVHDVDRMLAREGVDEPDDG